MKKRASEPAVVREARPEYRFDYSQSRPNRFARGMASGATLVVLDPDVAEVFGSSESVNELLRSVIAAFPGRDKNDVRSSKAPLSTGAGKRRHRR